MFNTLSADVSNSRH